MKKKVWIPLTIAAVTLVALVIYLNKRNNSSVTTPSYTTETVAKGTVSSTVTGSGNMTIKNTANVTTTISGKVRRLAVKQGDAVKKGQVLFYVDDDGNLDLSVNQAEATVQQSTQTVESAAASLMQAKQDLTDAEEQNNKTAGTISDTKLDILRQKIVVAQANYDSAVGNKVIAQKKYELAKVEAAKRNVTATIDGTISTLNIANGDQVGSGSSTNSTTATASNSSALMVINDLTSNKAVITVNEVDAGKVKVGQKAALTFDALTDLTLTGKVDSIATTGSVSSGVVSYEVTIALDNQDARVLPSMTVTAVITTEVQQDVVKVTSSAIQTDDTAGTKYVQVLKNGVSSKQTVETGISSDTETVITKGLAVGDVVITGTNATSTSTTTKSSTSTKSDTGGPGGGMPGLGGMF